MDFAFRARQVRYWLLKGLAHIYPDGLDLAELAGVLLGVDLATTEPEIGRHCQYLEEKGYLVSADRGKGQLRRKVFKLTAKGLDLLDGNIEADPGVGIGEAP